MLLEAVGNTLGSHIDQDMMPIIVALRTIDHGILEMKFDALAGFIHKVASSVLPLCHQVLQGRPQPSGV